jgi:hypothetical protein
MSELRIVEESGGRPEPEFQRTIVFRKDERIGAQLVLECGHAVFQVVAQPHMVVGRKIYCAGCVNYLVENKRELPQIYRLENRSTPCPCCGGQLVVAGPSERLQIHIPPDQLATSPDLAGMPVLHLNQAYEAGFIAGAKEALQTHG